MLRTVSADFMAKFAAARKDLVDVACEAAEKATAAHERGDAAGEAKWNKVLDNAAERVKKDNDALVAKSDAGYAANKAAENESLKKIVDASKRIEELSGTPVGGTASGGSAGGSAPKSAPAGVSSPKSGTAGGSAPKPSGGGRISGKAIAGGLAGLGLLVGGTLAAKAYMNRRKRGK